MKRYTVGQIATRTGLSVRALHHYETKGLLKPAGRSEGGYRMYGEAELLRLQHIVSLTALGMRLAEVRECLDADAPSVGEALHRQIERLRTAIDHQRQTLFRLEMLVRRFDGGAIDSELLLDTLETTTMMTTHFTPEQLDALRARSERLGPEYIRQVEQAWPDVIAGMRAAMELGRDPAAAEVMPIARRWRELVREFTGGDAGMLASSAAMFRENAEEMERRTGISPALMGYAQRAIAALPDGSARGAAAGDACTAAAPVEGCWSGARVPER